MSLLASAGPPGRTGSPDPVSAPPGTGGAPPGPVAAPRAGRVRRCGAGPVLALLGLAAVHAYVLVPAGWLPTGASAPRAAVGLAVIAVLPGALALRALGVRDRRGWEWLLFAVAFSLLGLLATSLALALLPGGGLTPLGCLLGLDLLVAVLAVAAAVGERRRDPGWSPLRPGPPEQEPVGGRRAGARPTRRAVAARRRGARRGRTAAGIGIAFGGAAVALTVTGAHQLNAGGGPGLSIAGLATATAALVAAVPAARRRQGTAAATVLFLVATAVLLATSLRGTGVTGHDIKIEYRVLLDTMHRDGWRPGGEYVGYNSCLSLTVLPAFLARLLGLAALDVFRVCFQILFAIVPVGAYLVARRLLPPGPAVLCGGLFIAFPTFVNDMPMLNRQEIALIFFTVLVLCLIDRRGPAWQRFALVGCAGAGMAVSHYSSTGIAAALLVVAWVLRRIQQSIGGLAYRHRTLPLGPVAVLLVVLAVGWPVVAGSGAAFGRNLAQTLAGVVNDASVSSESTRYSPLASGRGQDDASAVSHYAGYLMTTRSLADPGLPAECAPRVLPADTLPHGPATAAVTAVGVAPAAVNQVLRSGAVALFQVGAAVGCLILWWRVRRAHHLRRPTTPVLAQLGSAGIVLLAVNVVAPQLSDSYGLLRLYQQLLLLLAPAVIIAVLATLRGVTGRRTRHERGRSTVDAAVVALTVGCLLTTSGLVPRLVGDYPPQLSLANAGPYYRAYAAGPDDLALAAWLRTSLPRDAWVVADTRDAVNLRAMTQLSPAEGLTAASAPAGAHLAVATPDGAHAVATAVLGDRIVRYTFPLSCVGKDRPVLYAAGDHRVYGPRRS